MASACLPLLFRAVEIDGVSYWDGGYSGNPALLPFLRATATEDVLIVQINPRERRKTPTRTREILSRINEINFNASLLAELRAVDFVNRLIDEGRLPRGMREGEFRRLKLHRIVMEEMGASVRVAGTLNTEYQSSKGCTSSASAPRGVFLTRISTISAAAAPSILTVASRLEMVDNTRLSCLAGRTRACVTLGSMSGNVCSTAQRRDRLDRGSTSASPISPRSSSMPSSMPRTARCLAAAASMGRSIAPPEPDLKRECETLRRMRHGLRQDHPWISPASARHVIHAVGPVWSAAGAKARMSFLLPATAPRFRSRTQHRLASVAFPAISTGVYPFRPLARPALRWAR